MDLIGIIILVALGIVGAFGYYLYRKKAKLSGITWIDRDYDERLGDALSESTGPAAFREPPQAHST